jgi:hypothetical protein
VLSSRVELCCAVLCLGCSVVSGMGVGVGVRFSVDGQTCQACQAKSMLGWKRTAVAERVAGILRFAPQSSPRQPGIGFASRSTQHAARLLALRSHSILRSTDQPIYTCIRTYTHTLVQAWSLQSPCNRLYISGKCGTVNSPLSISSADSHVSDCNPRSAAQQPQCRRRNEQGPHLVEARPPGGAR